MTPAAKHDCLSRTVYLASMAIIVSSLSYLFVCYKDMSSVQAETRVLLGNNHPHSEIPPKWWIEVVQKEFTLLNKQMEQVQVKLDRLVTEMERLKKG